MTVRGRHHRTVDGACVWFRDGQYCVLLKTLTVHHAELYCVTFPNIELECLQFSLHLLELLVRHSFD